MLEETGTSRRSVLLGAAAGVVGAAAAATPLGSAVAAEAPTGVTPLWKAAARRGIVYGSSCATWQLDPDYSRLLRQQAALLWPEDDLLWWRIRPTPDSPLDFTYPDQFFEFAERNHQIVFGGPGLVWDDGFGDGWQDSDLWDISEKRARHLLFGTVRAVVHRYRRRAALWSVVCEPIVNGTDTGYRGLREDYPWFQTIGPEYIDEAFHVAHEEDPHACLVLNEFGFESDSPYGDKAIDKQRATLKVLDRLLDRGVPVHGLGVEAHLVAEGFEDRFRPRQFRRFLSEVADRGLKICITEMDVLDDGLPKAIGPRDRGVAHIYRRYLDVALEERDVKVVLNFGLSDAYTAENEDYPRDDGADRRPLPFDADMQATPAYFAIRHQLREAPHRRQAFQLRRHL